MKKLLIATAALAMVAGTVQAQSSVTVYGILDTGYNSIDNTVSNVSTTTNSIQTNGEYSTNRLGFRGTEDLGGGLKAHFQHETGLAANTIATFGNRAFWVGLEDATMGQIRVGRQDAFVRSVWLGHDQLAATNVVGNLAHDQVVGAATAAHTGRFEAINYFSPRISGAQVTAGIMINEVETTSTAKTASGTQVGLNYVAGNFSAAAAQTSVKTTTAAVTGVTGTLYCGTTAQGTVTSNPASAFAASCPTGTVYLAGSGYVAAAAAFDVKTKDTGAALSYDFGVVKVGYIYNDRDVNNGIQRESNSFSAAFPLTAKLTGRIGYGFGEYAATPTGAKYDITGMQASLGYELSKRTLAYAIYGDETRDTSATAETKSKEFSIGIRHTF
jgi:hypothetical protein